MRNHPGAAGPDRARRCPDPHELPALRGGFGIQTLQTELAFANPTSAPRWAIHRPGLLAGKVLVEEAGFDLQPLEDPCLEDGDPLLSLILPVAFQPHIFCVSLILPCSKRWSMYQDFGGVTLAVSS